MHRAQQASASKFGHRSSEGEQRKRAVVAMQARVRGAQARVKGKIRGWSAFRRMEAAAMHFHTAASEPSSSGASTSAPQP